MPKVGQIKAKTADSKGKAKSVKQASGIPVSLLLDTVKRAPKQSVPAHNGLRDAKQPASLKVNTHGGLRNPNAIANLKPFKAGSTPPAPPVTNPREATLRAFERLGGRKWLVRFGKKYPKEFASLLARAMTQEVSVTGMVGYAPLVIPVEQRESIPGLAVQPGAAPKLPVIEGEFTPIQPDEPDPFT